MFNGTIVIGKDTGGTKEQMDNGKTLVNEEIAFRYINLHDLIELLFKVQNLTSDLYINITKKAQNVVCELYDKENQSKKINEFYLKIKSK